MRERPVYTSAPVGGSLSSMNRWRRFDLLMIGAGKRCSNLGLSLNGARFCEWFLTTLTPPLFYKNPDEPHTTY